LYFALALLEVTSAGVFWIVALGPARCAMRAFSVMLFDFLFARG
jgi:hypothetical protein